MKEKPQFNLLRNTLGSLMLLTAIHDTQDANDAFDKGNYWDGIATAASATLFGTVGSSFVLKDLRRNRSIMLELERDQVKPTSKPQENIIDGEYRVIE